MTPLYFLWGICLLSSNPPLGPFHWTAKNWIGFFLQIVIFFLTLFFITKLADVEQDSNSSSNIPSPPTEQPPTPDSPHEVEK